MTEESDNPHKLTVDPSDPLTWIRDNYLDKVIAGENETKLLIFLVCCSAFTRNPLAAVVKGPSGAGKSHLVNRVLDLFRPMGVVIEFSRITPAYLENMAKANLSIPKPVMRKEVSREEYEDQLKSWREQPRRIDLTNKILFVDELRGIQSAQAPKLLLSEGRLRLGTVVDGAPVEIEVVGSPVIITTTTLTVLEDTEFENRVIPIQIDQTESQTKLVLEFESKHYEDPSEDLTGHRRIEALVEFRKGLKPYPIANPFAKKLAEDYPKKNMEARRDYRKLMNLSNVVTWLHQNQRLLFKKGLDVVFVAELSDLETVKALALGSLRESLAGVTHAEESILEFLRQSLNPAAVKQIYANTRRQTRRGEEWTRARVKRLVQDGYVEENEVSGKPWKLEYTLSELQPETLEIKTSDYSDQVIEDWAAQHGYVLTDASVLGLETPQGQSNPEPWAPTEPETFPYSDYGKESVPTGEFGKGQPRNRLLSKPKQSEGIPCPRCGINWPDQPSFDNHLSTYKHDK